jgi:DNA-binding transcriptional ArsR family regulator
LSDRESIFQALSHPLRQSVVSMLSEEPRTYTYLLEALDVESGHIAYHLRHMGGVVEKDDEGLYRLTKLGWEAYRFMAQERPQEEDAPVPFIRLLAYGAALVLIVILSSSVLIFTSTDGYIDPTGQYLTESIELTGRSLNIIYDIFDQTYIDRATWTDMTITLIKLQDRLEKLEESSGILYPECKELLFFIDEFTDVMSAPDSQFPSATIEHRPLLRDYHFLLVSLEPRLRTAL